MAIQEHAYYGSFGYHVTNFFAVSLIFVLFLKTFSVLACLLSLPVSSLSLSLSFALSRFLLLNALVMDHF